MRIPISYIIYNSSDLKAISVFIHMKRFFNNSTYYDWSVSYLSRITGMSKYSVSKWVEEFKVRGWVKEKGSDLVFKSIKNIFRKGRKTKCVFFKFSNHIDLLSSMRFFVLQRAIKGFEWLQQCSKNLRTKTGSAKQRLKICKIFTKKNYRDVSAAQEHYRASYSFIGRTFGCSAASAYRIMSEFSKTKGLVKFSKIRLLENVTLEMFKASDGIRSKGCFLSKGKVYQRSCNQYLIDDKKFSLVKN